MSGALESRQVPQADHSTLRGEHEGTETRYTIALRGFIDDRWAEAFRLSQTESTAYQRFRLSRATATIGFTSRDVDGAVHVFDLLESLDSLLKAANERLEFWHTQNPAVSSSYLKQGIA
jgi:hypothetical protein